MHANNARTFLARHVLSLDGRLIACLGARWLRPRLALLSSDGLLRQFQFGGTINLWRGLLLLYDKAVVLINARARVLDRIGLPRDALALLLVRCMPRSVVGGWRRPLLAKPGYDQGLAPVDGG